MPTAHLKRYRLYIEGTVQGVGFRPFVHNLAAKLGLSGFIRNDGGNVVIEVEGTERLLKNLVEEIRTNAPPLAKPDKIHVEESPVLGESGFRIETSNSYNSAPAMVPADTATCSDCLSELFDKNDRRFRYPFINCTNCGPRFTIIDELPFDRCRTTMRTFTMCAECSAEYHDPSNRRFHAQPNACGVCGPQLALAKYCAKQIYCSSAEDALKETVELLSDGAIVAIKGLGGFHLACDALSEKAVCRLRERKRRQQKPFAVMFPSIESIKRFAWVSNIQERLLLSPERPIVLLDSSPDKQKLATGICPGLIQLGAFLPGTPLQEILMRDFETPLVMTSANLSDEPICTENEECFERLKDIADAFLIHDRPISARYDDSVVSSVHNKPVVIRRARGLAPSAITVPIHSHRTILAVGPHLKNTFCFLRENQAYIGQHIGDLDDVLTFNHFEEALRTYQKLFHLQPDLIVCDLHPDYLSTTIAREYSQKFGIPFHAIQHHHAHIASCMAEHGINRKVIGVAFDGTGYGTDETAWGGEFLVADFKGFQRVAHFEKVPMPGGEAAIKEPWRMALAYGCSAPEEVIAQIGRRSYELVAQQLEKRVNSPMTSSCGRLFDAVSSLIGLCHQADYEGHAAMMLEALAWDGQRKTLGSYLYSRSLDEKNIIVLGFAETFAQIQYDLAHGVERSEISWKFHKTIANLIVDTCGSIRESTGIETICLSGGVFQNRLLTNAVLDLAEARNLEILIQERVPTNDGGISLGQAVIAASRLEETCV